MILFGNIRDKLILILVNSCQNNSRYQVHHDRRIVLRALKNISRGEEITTIYLSPLMGNVLRYAFAVTESGLIAYKEF